MTDNASNTRQPDAALRALDRLVGTWRISGDATGTVSYRWMDGGFFLIQEGDLELYGHHNTFTEIIGRERPFGGESSTDIKSRTYTSEGDTLEYVYELDGDTLTIWGGQRDSESYYRATPSAKTATPSAVRGPGRVVGTKQPARGSRTRTLHETGQRECHGDGHLH